MKEKIHFYITRIKEGRLKEMWCQTIWIYQYAKHHWFAMLFYTALGLTGTIVSLASSLVSRDLVNIITGHQTGKVIGTFCAMIGLNVGVTFVNQVSGCLLYTSAFGKVLMHIRLVITTI